MKLNKCCLSILIILLSISGNNTYAIPNVNEKSTDMQVEEIRKLIEGTPDRDQYGKKYNPLQRIYHKSELLYKKIDIARRLCDIDELKNYIDEYIMTLAYLTYGSPSNFPLQSTYLSELSVRFASAESRWKCGVNSDAALSEMLDIINSPAPVFLRRQHPGLILHEFAYYPSINVLETQYLIIQSTFIRSYLLKKKFKSLDEYKEISNYFLFGINEYYDKNKKFGIDPVILEITNGWLNLPVAHLYKGIKDRNSEYIKILEKAKIKFRDIYSSRDDVYSSRMRANLENTIALINDISYGQLLKAKLAYAVNDADLAWDVKYQKLNDSKSQILTFNFALSTSGVGAIGVDLLRHYAEQQDIKSFENFLLNDLHLQAPSEYSTDPADKDFGASHLVLGMYFEVYLASVKLGLPYYSDLYLKKFFEQLKALAFTNWIYIGRFSSEIFEKTIREYLFKTIGEANLSQNQKNEVAKALYLFVRNNGLINRFLDKLDNELKNNPKNEFLFKSKTLMFQWESKLGKYKANPTEENRKEFREVNEELLQTRLSLETNNYIVSLRKNILRENVDPFIIDETLAHDDILELLWLQDPASRSIFFLSLQNSEFQFFELDYDSLEEHSISSLNAIQYDVSQSGRIATKQLKELTDFALPQVIRESLLASKNSEVRVYTEGFLSIVPFESFVINNENFVIESHTVSYQALPGALSSRVSPKPNITNVTVFADADYGQLPEDQITVAMRSAEQNAASRSSSFVRGLKPLQYTRYEADSILKTMTKAGAKVLVFDGKDASIENFLSSDTPDLLHLALHGFVQSDKAIYRGQTLQYLTGIAFSGANESYSSLLTINSVMKPNLRGTDLVVLAACDTNVSDYSQASDYVSMRNMFLALGANHVMAAHWSLLDAPTSDLMNSFYTNLSEGMHYTKALRLSKLKKIAITRNPALWSGLTLTSQ